MQINNESKDELRKNEVIYVYSKKVNDSNINCDKKTRKIDIDKIKNVVNSLLDLGKTKKFDDFELNENCKNWINNLFSSYPSIDQRDAKELLNDFTDAMKTRMREEEKYAISIITSEFILLCHNRYGEETITPNWKVINRMLDKDNVLRFVCFKQSEKIDVIYYETHPSIFFAEWLGIPQREAFEYLGGKNKICGEIHGVPIALELSDDDFEDKFIKNKVFEVKDGAIILQSSVERIPLLLIRVGRKSYTNYEDFLQDFLAKQYNLSYYMEEYNKLKNSLDSYTEKIFDEKDRVVKSVNKSDVTIVRKTNPHFFILFVNENIEIRASFLGDIRTKLLNNEQFKIYHAGCKFSPRPIKIKNMEIYNDIKNEYTKILLDYYKELQMTDTLDKILLGTILKLLSIENEGKDICYFLNHLSEKIFEELNFTDKFVNHEDKILELKSGDVVLKKDGEIISYLRNDLVTKLKDSNIKIYIIGVNEKTQDCEPIPISRFNDDRINRIIEKLKEATGFDIYIYKIPYNTNKCLLLMIAKKLNQKLNSNK
ncbi:hypothetical protein HRbin04_00662 [archaeon HR04]|jgi:hypothetical protein|nr:hypothetical protein HRbin04_00662 [archaeon HR04]